MVLNTAPGHRHRKVAFKHFRGIKGKHRDRVVGTDAACRQARCDARAAITGLRPGVTTLGCRSAIRVADKYPRYAAERKAASAGTKLAPLGSSWSYSIVIASYITRVASVIALPYRRSPRVEHAVDSLPRRIGCDQGQERTPLGVVKILFAPNRSGVDISAGDDSGHFAADIDVMRHEHTLVA